MDLPPPSTNSRSFRPYRRRRILWTAFFLFIGFIYLFAPPSFWDTSSYHARKLAEVGKSWVPGPLNGNTLEERPYAEGEELQSFLHMVASTELTIPSTSDSSKPLPREVYTGGIEEDVAWLQEVQSDPPVIVFSKTTCPYSKRAKELLKSYDISPQPKIIEVDLRDDSDLIKSVLTRLTHHSTFPNVFISGKSIGGSDDLQHLHASGELVTTLDSAGVSNNYQAEKQPEKKVVIVKEED